jgi:transcription-repair coupling factor (superfamily II helicase)
LKATATHLLKAVRERKSKSAPRMLPPLVQYERFAARFPYMPTADQAKAIDDA